MITRSIKKMLSGSKGGGGGGTTTTESIPAWARPYIERAQQRAEGLYEQGALSRVAGSSSIQDKAFGQAGNLEQATEGAVASGQGQMGRLTTLAETGGMDDNMASAAFNAAKAQAGIGREYGATGTLGSAKHRIADATMQAEMADRGRQQTFQNKLSAEQGLGQAAQGTLGAASSGASSLAQLGDIQRTLEQQLLDKDWQGLQRYASTVYGNPARQQAVSSGGGGK